MPLQGGAHRVQCNQAATLLDTVDPLKSTCLNSVVTIFVVKKMRHRLLQHAAFIKKTFNRRIPA